MLDVAAQTIGEKGGLSLSPPTLDGHELGEIELVAIKALYEPFVERQRREAEKLKQVQDLAIPESFDYASVPSLSAELRDKLIAQRPRTTGEAGRIEGMTPAAQLVLLARLTQTQKPSADVRYAVR